MKKEAEMKYLVFLLVVFLYPMRVEASGWTPARLKRYFASEPSLRDLQNAALKFFMVNPERLRSLRRKAANKAWMPVVSAGFTGNMGQDRREMELAQYRTAYPDVAWEEETQINVGYQFSVRATWNLPQLVFNPEELDVASMVGIQDGVLKEITRLYFIRRRLQVNLLMSPPADAATAVMLDLRLQELTGLLDAMTNGYLSRELEKAEKAERERAAKKNEARMREIAKEREVTPSDKTEGGVGEPEREVTHPSERTEEQPPKERREEEKVVTSER